MNFTELYKNVTTEEKLTYLSDILQNNTDMQRDFMEKVAVVIQNTEHSDINTIDFKSLVDEFTKDILEEFECVDISEMDWDNYHDSGHYVEEWEVYQENAESEIHDAFQPVNDFLLDTILSNEIVEATAYVCALYKVCNIVEIDDPNESLGDMQRDTWLENMNNTLKYTQERILQVPGNNKIFDKAVQSFFEYFNNNLSENIELAKDLENILLILVEKGENQENIYEYIQEVGISSKLFPNIFNYFINEFETEEKWLKFAYDNYLLRDDISEKLLKYLHENDTDKFIEIGFSLINNNDKWNKFLLEYLDKQTHTELFKQVYLNVSNNNSDIKLYKEIQNILLEEEKNKFIDSIWNDTFKVKVYVAEKQFENAKNIVKKCNSLYDFSDIISPLFVDEPKFCFSRTTEFLFYAVEQFRGREKYKEMAEVLKIALTIPNYTEKVRILIIDIYNFNSRLRALKEEFRDAGIIST